MHGAIDELVRDDDLSKTWARTPQSGRQLFFFCPDVTDASTLKRAQQFIDHGYGVTVFGFRRERYNMAYRPAWPHVPLGHTADGKYWHRVRALLGALPIVFAHRFLFKSASVFYARNIDQLLLALLARLLVLSKVPIAYEVLDIPPILMRHGLVARSMRSPTTSMFGRGVAGSAALIRAARLLASPMRARTINVAALGTGA